MSTFSWLLRSANVSSHRQRDMTHPRQHFIRNTPMPFPNIVSRRLSLLRISTPITRSGEAHGLIPEGGILHTGPHLSGYLYRRTTGSLRYHGGTSCSARLDLAFASGSLLSYYCQSTLLETGGSDYTLLNKTVLANILGHYIFHMWM